MTDVPFATAVARPVALMVAVANVPDVQEADDVMFCVVPSERVAVAVNCSVVPLAIVGLDGVTEMLTTVAPLTTTTSVQAIAAVPLPVVDVMIGAPPLTPVTRPVAAPTVASVASLEVHADVVVMSFVVPSVKTPVALSCTMPPTVTVAGLAGPIVQDLRVALVTARAAVPLMPETVAVMVVVPIATPVARPPVTVAVARVLDCHIAEDVTSCVVMSESVAVAVNCCV